MIDSDKLRRDRRWASLAVGPRFSVQRQWLGASLLLCAAALGILTACAAELPEERLGRTLAKAKGVLWQCRERIPIPSLKEYRDPIRSQVKAALDTYDFLGLSDEDRLLVLRAHLDGEAAKDFDELPKREQYKVIEHVTRTYRTLVRQRCARELDELDAAIEARDLYLRSRHRSNRDVRSEAVRAGVELWDAFASDRAPNNAAERTAGSHSLAAAAHRQCYAAGGRV